MGEASDSHLAATPRDARVGGRRSPAWAPAREADAVWRSWDDRAVVHHARSNETHLVDGAAHRVLQALREHSPQTAAQLAAALNAESWRVREVLESLESVDLVMRC